MCIFRNLVVLITYSPTYMTSTKTHADVDVDDNLPERIVMLLAGLSVKNSTVLRIHPTRSRPCVCEDVLHFVVDINTFLFSQKTFFLSRYFNIFA